MKKLYSKALVTKSNMLNEMRANNFTLQELRLFSIYLARINPWDKESRFVKFPLSEYQKIMDLGKLNLLQIKTSTDKLFNKRVDIGTKSGGYETYSLFSKCKVDKDSSGEWYVEISANNDIMPFMFDFRNRYFSYELWNALRLGSANQVRMYELLKQYEKIGQREIAVDDLRAMLGIAPGEYERFNNFKIRVLESCQAALHRTTDIKFTFRKGKSGKGGKWETIIFDIEKNTEYIDQITLFDFISEEDLPTIEGSAQAETETEQSDKLAEFCRDAFDNVFSAAEVRTFINEILPKVGAGASDLKIYGECKKVYDRFKVEQQQSKRKGEEIKHPYKYIMKMIKNDN